MTLTVHSQKESLVLEEGTDNILSVVTKEQLKSTEKLKLKKAQRKRRAFCRPFFLAPKVV